jgi:hypothetical protein
MGAVGGWRAACEPRNQHGLMQSISAPGPHLDGDRALGALERQPARGHTVPRVRGCRVRAAGGRPPAQVPAPAGRGRSGRAGSRRAGGAVRRVWHVRRARRASSCSTWCRQHGPPRRGPAAPPPGRTCPPRRPLVAPPARARSPPRRCRAGPSAARGAGRRAPAGEQLPAGDRPPLQGAAAAAPGRRPTGIEALPSRRVAPVAEQPGWAARGARVGAGNERVGRVRTC